MEPFLSLIGNQNFVNFLSTFGLAVVIVVYFVFVRDPKQAKYWQSKYDDLSTSYSGLSDAYKLLNSKVPETRELSPEQAIRLCNIAIDRDLYKLYTQCCQKLEGKEDKDIINFIKESVMDTNDTWAQFTSPFPQVPQISDLYGVYKNNGAQLTGEIKEILDGSQSPDDKKMAMWNKLLKSTLDMKDEFREHLKKLKEGKPVTPYGKTEQAEAEA